MDVFAGYYYTRNCEFLTCSLHRELHALKRLMQTFKVHSFLSFWLKYTLQSLFPLLKIMLFHVFLTPKHLHNFDPKSRSNCHP